MNLNTAPEHTTDPDVSHMVIYENLTAGLGGKVALSPWVRGRTEITARACILAEAATSREKKVSG